MKGSMLSREDRRLREAAIDPEGDPIEAMMEVSRRAQRRREEQERKRQQP